MAGFAIARKGGVIVPPMNRGRSTAHISIWVNGRNIGFITALRETSNRRAERVRHMHAGDAGRTIEVVLGPEEITLDADGIGLYANDIPETFADVAGRISGKEDPDFRSLEDQCIPFDIIVEEVRTICPGGDDSPYPSAAMRTRATAYRMCYLTNHTIARSIDQLQVTETASMMVGWVEAVNPIALEVEIGMSETG